MGDFYIHCLKYSSKFNTYITAIKLDFVYQTLEKITD